MEGQHGGPDGTMATGMTLTPSTIFQAPKEMNF